jgi:hypothetical protein
MTNGSIAWETIRTKSTSPWTCGSIPIKKKKNKSEEKISKKFKKNQCSDTSVRVGQGVMNYINIILME